MTSKELEKYLGKYVSFTINECAFLPAPTVEGEDLRDNNHHMGGKLVRNNGILSHFALDFYNEDTKQIEGIAIRDDTIPYIENFKVIDEGELELCLD